MKKTLLIGMLLLAFSLSYAQKTVYIPTQFSEAPWNEWSWSKTYQSANFCIFWGNKVGTNPATYSDVNLRFDPAVVAGYLEASFAKFVTEIGFVSNASTKQLGQYKIIIVMNDTYNGANGPTGWAFGGSYDNTIGAMWVHPNATRDAYVLSHEFAHSLQGQISIQENTTGGGYVGYDPAGWFWECHANYMRCVEFPQFAADDMPRWTATSSYHMSSTRHHYTTFKWLMNIQQNYGGTNMVNRMWRESVANEHPVVTFRRLNGWSQTQLNDFMYDYAKREVIFDYPAQGFGTAMRTQRNTFKTNAGENHYLWRVYTLLNQVSASSGRYIVPDYSAPQDYGLNIIPLYTTCASKTVHVKFKGHTEVNSTAGWRWGFVAVKANGTTVRYGTMSNASDGEATFALAADETQLYLVVVGAPTTHTSYLWEAGWPKIKRYPYELRIENAVPEGYQSTYRDDVRALYAGHTHSNGGGWVANTATVASSVYVAPKALVVGTSNLSGNVRVEGTARLERVTASGSVVFSGDVNVIGGTYTNAVQVQERAILNDCSASGNAIIKGNALAWGSTYGNGVVVGGDAELGSCSTAGVYLQTPHPNNGRAECDGKGASDASNTDVNAAYTQFTDAQMSWIAIGCGGTADTQAPSIPGTPTSSNVTSTGVTLSWTAATDNVAVTGYDILQNGTVVQTVTGTTAGLSGLTASTNYSFTVKAKDAAGNISAASGALSVTTAGSGGTGPVAGGIYKITARHSGKSFCMRGGTGATGNNVQLTQYTYQSGTHQQFKAEANGTYFRLTPQHATGKALDVTGNATADGANIIQYTWSGSNNQQWSFVSIGSGYYQIVSRSSGKCLGVASASTADDANVQQFTCSTSATNQHFTFEAIAAASAVTLMDTDARIATEESKLQIYPNPVRGSFTVELSGFSPQEEITLQVVNLAGKEIFTDELKLKRTATYNTASYEMKESVYILKAVNSKRVLIQKMLVLE
jgi:hypothetical protein